MAGFGQRATPRDAGWYGNMLRGMAQQQLANNKQNQDLSVRNMGAQIQTDQYNRSGQQIKDAVGEYNNPSVPVYTEAPPVATPPPVTGSANGPANGQPSSPPWLRNYATPLGAPSAPNKTDRYNTLQRHLAMIDDPRASKLAEVMAKTRGADYTLNQGAKRFHGSTLIASGEPKPDPVVLASKSMVVNGVTKIRDTYGEKGVGGVPDKIMDYKYSEFQPNAGQITGVGVDPSKWTPQYRDLVNGVINYTIDPTKTSSIRGNAREKLVSDAKALDPSYDMSQFPVKTATRIDFTSGKSAANIKSLRTVAHHIDNLESLGTALQNGDIPAINQAGNFLSTLVGKSKVMNFNTAQNAVADEFTTVLKNTGATDQTIAAAKESMPGPNSSPEQIKGGIQTLLMLVNGRLDALRQQYETSMGKPLDFRLLDPETEAVFQKHGINPVDLGAKAQNSFSPEDQQAINWARQHRTDPQAKKILNLHGVK